MKMILAAVSAMALIASANIAVAGGLNDAISDDTVIAAGPSSSFPVWLIIPVVACAVACGGSNGGTNGTTGGN